MDTKIKDRFRSYLINRENCCSETADQYIHSLNLFEEFCLQSGAGPVIDLEDPELAYELLIGLKLSRKNRHGKPGWSQEMTYKTGSVMSKFYRFAIRFKIKTTPNPFADGPGVKRSKRKAPPYIPWDHPDMKRILAYPRTYRDKAMIWLLFSAGLRREEVVTRKIRDLLPNRVIRVEGKGGKVREVPVCPQTHLYLNLQMRDLHCKGYTGEWLFPRFDFSNHLSPEGIYKYVKRMGKALGLDHIYPHLFRHSFASHFIKFTHVQNVSAMLGHEDIKTTMIYSHVANETLREVHTQHSLPFPAMDPAQPEPMPEPLENAWTRASNFGPNRSTCRLGVGE